MKYEPELNINQPEQRRLIRTRIQLGLKTVAKPGIRVVFRHPTDAHVEAAIAFGVGSATARVPLGGNRQGIDVTVFFVEYEHLGPRLPIVAMLACRCACEALGVPEDSMPRFDTVRCGVLWPLD